MRADFRRKEPEAKVNECVSYARYSAFVPSVSGLMIQEKCEKYGHRENTQAEKYCQQMI